MRATSVKSTKRLRFVFGDAKEVLIKTSKGNDKVEYVKISPILGTEGNIIDFDCPIREKVEIAGWLTVMYAGMIISILGHMMMFWALPMCGKNIQGG